MISPISRNLFRFSSNAIAAKTYAKFQEKYSAHLQAFKQKTAEHQKASETVKRSTQKVYTHPFDDLHHRPHFSVLRNLQCMLDVVGAEQVSAHYENFGRARRDLLFFWGFYFAMRFIAATPDFSYYADAMAPAAFVVFGSVYWFLEGKTYLMMPILIHFYRKIAHHEMNNLEAYYAENIEVRVRNLMAKAKSQIDFKTLHTDYLSVRNNTILNVKLPLFSSSSTSKSCSRTTSTNEPTTFLNKQKLLKP